MKTIKNIEDAERIAALRHEIHCLDGKDCYCTGGSKYGDLDDYLEEIIGLLPHCRLRSSLVDIQQLVQELPDDCWRDYQDEEVDEEEAIDNYNEIIAKANDLIEIWLKEQEEKLDLAKNSISPTGIARERRARRILYGQA